eukprot:Gb_01935 [translate_table: standard]
MAQGGNRYRVIGDYVVGQQIGSGSFAVVWRSRHRHHGYEVAIKEIATEKLSKKLRASLFLEIEILRQINHPNIIRLHEIVEGKKPGIAPGFYILLITCYYLLNYMVVASFHQTVSAHKLSMPPIK